MTLARRLTRTIIALTLGLTLMALTPLWVMSGIRASVHLAYDEYKELRMVDGAVLHLGAILGLLHGTEPDGGEIASELEQADAELGRFLVFQQTQSTEAEEHEGNEHRIAGRTREHIVELQRLVAEAAVGGGRLSQARAGELRGGVEATLEQLRTLSDQTAAGIEQSQARVFDRIAQAMVISSALALLTCAGVIHLSVVQYRGVIRPLRRLREGVRRIGAGEFSERLGISSEDEIGEVAREFDRMSERLGSLYRDLEDKDRRASRELARSERLASVGFLAAGVAHEINNPLNIISGHAELMLRRLDRDRPGSTACLAGREELQIIREESFRCKHIIERLLSLSRPGGGESGPVDLAVVAAEVVRNVQSLHQYEHSRIEPLGEKCTVMANEPEVKQVMLNLLLNALQALPAAGGHVRVTTRCSGGMGLLAVEDNGRGMSSQTVERVFEPFFTQRRGTAEPGTGLGLSISHAIVEAHGGTIHAESAGPGRGSRFTVAWPLAISQGAPA